MFVEWAPCKTWLRGGGSARQGRADLQRIQAEWKRFQKQRGGGKEACGRRSGRSDFMTRKAKAVVNREKERRQAG